MAYVHDLSTPEVHMTLILCVYIISPELYSSASVERRKADILVFNQVWSIFQAYLKHPMQ